MDRRVALFVIAGLLIALLPGCDWLTPERESRDHDRQPYRFIPAMAAGAAAAVVDPYDGSVDLFDPRANTRRSIGTSWNIVHQTVMSDGGAVALLDGERNRVHVVDVASGRDAAQIDVGETVNRLIPSPYAPLLLALYDPDYGEVEFGDSGVINYFELDIVDLEASTARPVSIDFTPDNIVFTPDRSACLLGKDYRLLALDLATAKTTAFPLSLGPDDPRTPRAIAVSDDGELAMALVQETTDVYVLDLRGRTINILDLAGDASAVAFIPGTHQALLPTPQQEAVAFVDLDAAIPEETDLGFSADQVRLSPDAARALFYQTGGTTVGVMDLVSREQRRYPLNGPLAGDPAEPVAFSPDGRRVLAMSASHGNVYGQYAIDLIDLDSRVVAPIGLEAAATSYAFSAAQPMLGLLLPAAKKFVRLDLMTFQARAWKIGGGGVNALYLPGAAAFAVDFDNREGKIAFLGDFGADLFLEKTEFFDSWK